MIWPATHRRKPNPPRPTSGQRPWSPQQSPTKTSPHLHNRSNAGRTPTELTLQQKTNAAQRSQSQKIHARPSKLIESRPHAKLRCGREPSKWWYNRTLPYQLAHCNTYPGPNNDAKNTANALAPTTGRTKDRTLRRRTLSYAAKRNKALGKRIHETTDKPMNAARCTDERIIYCGGGGGGGGATRPNDTNNHAPAIYARGWHTLKHPKHRALLRHMHVGAPRATKQAQARGQWGATPINTMGVAWAKEGVHVHAGKRAMANISTHRTGNM